MARYNGTGRQGSSILYSILKNECSDSIPQSPAACSCVPEPRAALRCPQVTSTAASAVLLKTLKFVQNVPCFRELPPGDQMLLLRSGWAQLLVLGMAQDRLDFDTTEGAERSLLQSILTGALERARCWRQAERLGAPVAEIRAIKGVLRRFWALHISTKEYAYLKGAVLFSPDLEGLRCRRHIAGLQREAHRALHEHVRTARGGREEGARFARLLSALATLRRVSASAVAELFLRPILGPVDVEQMLREMLRGKEAQDA